MKDQLTFFEIPKRSPKPYVWDTRTDYSLILLDDGRPLARVLAGTWSDIKKAANQKARELQNEGHETLEVVWENYPDCMLDKVLNTFFSWESPLA